MHSHVDEALWIQLILSPKCFWTQIETCGISVTLTHWFARTNTSELSYHYRLSADYLSSFTLWLWYSIFPSQGYRNWGLHFLFSTDCSAALGGGEILECSKSMIEDRGSDERDLSFEPAPIYRLNATRSKMNICLRFVHRTNAQWRNDRFQLPQTFPCSLI